MVSAYPELAVLGSGLEGLLLSARVGWAVEQDRMVVNPVRRFECEQFTAKAGKEFHGGPHASVCMGSALGVLSPG